MSYNTAIWQVGGVRTVEFAEAWGEEGQG